MKSMKPWVNALGINPDQYQQWCDSVPANTSLTHWCLEQGHIPPGEYLKWAQEFYGLPILRPEFFENRPNKEVYEMLSTVANWSAEMIPIHEWDGVVFVACVEPVEEVQWSFPVRYVLASSSELKDYWNALSEVTRVRAPAPAPEPAPAPVAESAPPTPPAPPALPEDDAPGGLNLNLAPARKERDFLAELAQEVKPEDEISTKVGPAPEEDNMPEGINLKITEPIPPMPENTFTGLHVMPVAPADVATPPLPKDASHEGMSEQARQFGEPFFNDMQNEFEGAMILLTTGDKLTPWCWDARFAEPTHKGPSVDLGKPSAFRIAYRTKMPYLGHVVETPTNLDFFKGWGYNEMPESIVAHPLVSNSNVVGVLLLKAKKTQKQAHVLTSSEQFAARIAHALAPIAGKAA